MCDKMRTLYKSLGVPEEYIPFLLTGEHFKLEKWDSQSRFDKMDEWVGDDSTRRAFMYYHMEHTVFDWNYLART